MRNPLLTRFSNPPRYSSFNCHSSLFRGVKPAGRINKKLTEDIRGTRYRLEGPALDGRTIYILCRFEEDANLIIITVYAL
jgi:hypothetical protein